MGLFDDDDFELDELLDSVKSYPSCVAELNGGIAQEIFNKCLRKESSKEISKSALFSRILGYSLEEEKIIDFDKDALVKNEKNIRYLFGQLEVVHTGEGKKRRLSLDDLMSDYTGKNWPTSKECLLQLLYLGVNESVPLMFPFSKRNNDTTIISKDIVPTLSPKDPNFSAWWEAHKAEWE